MSTRKPLRQKKLNVKTALPVLREDQIDSSEYESLTTEFQIATGVDHAEENEIHLQAALKGAGASTDNEIPVPPPQESAVNYDELYPNPFIEPRNYIKFSDTVEETLGSLYDMTTEDDEYLKTYNAKKAGNAQLSENDFERIMEFFEVTASEQAPFAAVDNTIVSYEVMAQHVAHSPINKLQQTHTKQVYEYWKTRRQATSNKPLHPSLKFETHQEHDDLDPYVCFRRREVRQTRKTRQRDVLVVDRLKRLRRELEDARQLVLLSHHRELMKREMLHTERHLFEHRAKLKEKKVRLGIKTDDEDLYNTKPQRRKISEVHQQRTGAPHTSLRLTVDRRPPEQELVLLSDKQEEKYEELRRDIEARIQTHKNWNQKHVDLTEKPLSPVSEEVDQSFRLAKAQFLPTPPASASDSMDIDDEPAGAVAPFKPAPEPFIFRGASPEPEPVPAYRRRIGRGGRLWIDRRGIGRLASPPSEAERPVTERQRDQFKYDQDESDDEQPVYYVDPYDTRPMKFRATIPLPMYRYPPRQVPAALTDGHGNSQVGPANRQVQVAAQAQQKTAQGSLEGQHQGQKQTGQAVP